MVSWNCGVAFDSWKPIADYVEKQFEQYYQDETGLDRHNIKDTRVHCCLYFIPPYGHGYECLDNIYIYIKLVIVYCHCV